MTRHIIDHPKARDESARARAFLKIERDVRPSEATRKLQKEPRVTGAGRMKQYLRIEKGRVG